jgi:hypothetical protein
LKAGTRVVRRTRRRKGCAHVAEGRACVGWRRRPPGDLLAELIDFATLYRPRDRPAGQRRVRAARRGAHPRAVRTDRIRAHATRRAPAVDRDRRAGRAVGRRVSGVVVGRVGRPAVAGPRGRRRRAAAARSADREQSHDDCASHETNRPPLADRTRRLEEGRVDAALPSSADLGRVDERA